MAGYEPKGKIEPDPDAPKHTCSHEGSHVKDHPCTCSIGVDHTLGQWVDDHPGEADTAGDR